MEKFSTHPDDLDLAALLDCIIYKSTFAVKVKPMDYYTCNGIPNDWEKQFMGDVRKAVKTDYDGYVFYVVYFKDTERVAHIFYQDNVYYFDPYFSDCPILQNILIFDILHKLFS